MTLLRTRASATRPEIAIPDQWLELEIMFFFLKQIQ